VIVVQVEREDLQLAVVPLASATAAARSSVASQTSEPV
jgi:hypothetical protein